LHRIANLVVGDLGKTRHYVGGHFPVSGCRCEFELKKPLHTGHFKTAAVYLGNVGWQE
jgi:hypothetical protein